MTDNDRLSEIKENSVSHYLLVDCDPIVIAVADVDWLISEVERSRGVISDIRSRAFAETNPANWQKPPNGALDRLRAYETFLDALADEQPEENEWIYNLVKENRDLKAALSNKEIRP